MAIYAPERIGTVSTEQVVLDMQQALLPRVAEAPQAVFPSQDGRQRYYAGVNATATIFRKSGGLFVHYASLPSHLHDKPGNDPLELTLGFADETGELEPLPLTNEDSCRLVTSSAHTAERLPYSLTLWSDGGYSFESGQRTPSLDQMAITDVAHFVDEMAETRLILAKERR